MRVTVTGGAGFIGSHVVDRLLAAGHEPRIFDLVRSPYRGDVDTVQGDLLDPGAVRRALRGADAVIHLAAVSDVNLVIADPGRADLVNVRSTRALLDASRTARVGRFLYASTVWVYDHVSAPEPVDEDAALSMPAHLYTATKLAGEMYCHTYGELYGLEYTILRFGIPYGPRARESTVAAAFVARARAGKALTIMGDGRQSRQFLYVEDLAEGVVAALAPQAACRTFNLVSEESVTVRTIAETVRDLVAPVPIVHVADRPGDARIAHVSHERAVRELGWRATTPFAEGMRRYVDWVAETSGSPSSSAAWRIEGSAEAVLRQESGEL